MKERTLLEKLNIEQPKPKLSFREKLEDIIPVLFLGNIVLVIGSMFNAAFFSGLGLIAATFNFQTLFFKVALYSFALGFVESIILAIQLYIISKKFYLTIY